MGHTVLQYIPRNMHTVFALLCFVVVIHWLIFPYPSALLHWHCGNLTIAPVPAKQPWWIWINTSCEFIMNDCITTTKQSTTKPCAYFMGHAVLCQSQLTRQDTKESITWTRKVIAHSHNNATRLPVCRPNYQTPGLFTPLFTRKQVLVINMSFWICFFNILADILTVIFQIQF